VQVKDKRGRAQVLDDDRTGVAFDRPVIVLVDRFSASASEIVAGALQDYKRALIVGTGPTHGKGTVQQLADLDSGGGQLDLGVLKVTIQQFFRVTGSSTQREGVKPDVLLPDPMGHVESGERELPHAIEWSTVASTKFAPWPAAWNASALAKSSAARVAKHPVLSKLSATTAILKARRDETRLPLGKAAWDKRRTALKAALEAANPDTKKLAPVLVVKPLEVSDKPDERIVKWSENLAKDVWLDETFAILAEMK
jgi:carboxyl-terminal processing protease